jgi:hypothetical protein
LRVTSFLLHLANNAAARYRLCHAAIIHFHLTNFYPMRLLLALLGGFFISLAPAHAQKTYLHCGRLLDVRTGRLQPDMTVVVENGRVAAVQSGFATGSGADKVIDLKNKTVMPGLLDMQSHSPVPAATQTPPTATAKT